MPSPRLSAAIITKDEEEKIGDCIDSLSFADEIVVVDSGSTDKTVEIARAKGAKVVFNRWPGHVEQKNFAIGQTKEEWVISLDADERISKNLREEILKKLEKPQADGYSIPRLVYYTNRWIRHCGWYPARKVRLFRRNMGRWGGENPHDRIILGGKEEKLSGDIYHLSFDNISEHVQTIDLFTEIAAKERVSKGKTARLFTILLRPPATFIKMFILKRGFLDGIPGFIVSVLSTYHVFNKYVKLWEMNKD